MNTDNIWPVVTLKKAKRNKLSFYYQGKLCMKGHDSPKFTSNNKCLKCYSLNAYLWLEKKQIYWNSLSLQEKRRLYNMSYSLCHMNTPEVVKYKDTKKWSIRYLTNERTLPIKELEIPYSCYDTSIPDGYFKFLNDSENVQTSTKYYLISPEGPVQITRDLRDIVIFAQLLVTN